MVEKYKKIGHNMYMKKKYLLSIIVMLIWMATSYTSCPGTPYDVLSQGQNGFNLCKNTNTGKYYLAKKFEIKGQMVSTCCIPWSGTYQIYTGNVYAHVPGGYEYVSGPDENGYTKYKAMVPEAVWRNILVMIHIYTLSDAEHTTGVTIVED